MLKECVVCGNKVPSDNPRAQYCSRACRCKAPRLRNPEKVRARDREAYRKKTSGLNMSKNCVVCGAIFSTRHPKYNVCSEGCRDVRIRGQKAENNRKRRAEGKAKDWEYYHLRGGRERMEARYAKLSAAVRLVRELEEKGIEALL